jgi:hypothetical protein
MATLKLVAVKITVFTRQRDAGKLLAYIWACLSDGLNATLYENPNILSAFYTLGNDAWEALDLAISDYSKNTTPDNLKIVKAKMALVVIWLRAYASKVQVIANLPANATTREEVVINIGQSYLTAQKLVQSKKGDPQIPEMTGKNVGIGTIDIEVVNIDNFNPTGIVFIAVEVPVTPITVPPSAATPPAVVELKDGQLLITSTVAVQTASISIEGKGRTVTFIGLKPGKLYAIYAYTRNGKKQVSKLSAPIYVYG